MDTFPEQRKVLKDYRDTQGARAAAVANLRTDFIHYLIIDTGARTSGVVTGNLSWDKSTIAALERGAVTAISDARTYFDRLTAVGYTKLDEYFMAAVAHELVHLLVDKNSGAVPGVGFDLGEHVPDPDRNGVLGNAADRTELMYAGTTVQNRELATVRIFPIVQEALETKSSLGLIP